MLEDIPLHRPPAPPKVIDHEDVDGLPLKDQLAYRMRQASRLYTAIEHEDEVPANQKAQVLNTITSIIGQLNKLEAEMHSIEAVKKLERALITCLKTAPEDVQKAFFEAYEAELARTTP